MRMCPRVSCTPQDQRISRGSLVRPLRLVADKDTLTAMVQPLPHHDMGSWLMCFVSRSPCERPVQRCSFRQRDDRKADHRTDKSSH